MINCNYGENFRNLSFPCTEKELQIFCDSLALPNNAGTQIRVDHSHNNPKVDALLAGKEVRLDELNYPKTAGTPPTPCKRVTVFGS